MKKTGWLLILLVAGVLGAQPIEVKWGPELGKPKKTDITAIIGAYGDAFYALRRGIGLFNGDEIYLERYSKTSLRLENIRPVKLQGMNGKRLVFERAFVLGPTILLFLSYYDKDQDKNIAYVQKIDGTDGSVSAPSREVDFIPALKKRNAGTFDFVLSRDSTKILILHNDPFDRYANEKFSYKVLDANGDEIWSAVLELPYLDRAFKISNYIVDNEGNVFMLASLEKNRQDQERKKPGYVYELLSYDYRSKRLRERAIDLGDKFISDIAFDVHNHDTIIIGGFYSNKSSGGLAGSFFISMNSRTQDIIAQGSKDFSSEFLGEFMSKRRAEKHKELYNYSIDHLLTRSDGGACIVAEQYYMTVSTYYSRYGSSVTYNYYYNDIIVINVNPDGSIEWIKKIPKYQHSTNDNGFFSSYAMNTANGKLYFVFNDNPKNLDPTSKRLRPAFSRRTITVVASIDQDGRIKKEALIGSSLGRIYTRPKISLAIGDQETLIYALRRKTFKFAVIKY